MVTGASFGLGKAMAEGLAEAGADIVGISRQRENLAEVEQAVTACARRFLALECDVGDRTQLRDAVSASHGWQNRLDILINNAGIIHRDAAAEHPEEAWDQVLARQSRRRLVRQPGGGKGDAPARPAVRSSRPPRFSAFPEGFWFPGTPPAKGPLRSLPRRWPMSGPLTGST